MESRASLILVGNIIPFVVGSFFWYGRVWSRAVILNTWGSDDWLLTVGWVAALANVIMACMATQYGAGHHIGDIATADLVPATKLSFGTLIVYQASLCFTKLSVCSLYLRVFTTSRNGQLMLYGSFGFIISLNLAGECVSFFQCKPIQGVWNPSIKSSCISTIPMFYVYAVCNIIVDIFLMVFALLKIMTLKMAPRQKYALMATIALGGVPCIASIVRCARVSQILNSSDPTWKSYDSSIWSAVDANVSILCASTPALKPLLRQIAPGLMGSTFGTSQPGANSSRFPSGGRSWLGTTKGTGKGYELHSAPRHGDLHSTSQTELAYSVGQSEWSTSTHKHDGNVTDDDVVDEGGSYTGEPGILKSTHVIISSISN